MHINGPGPNGPRGGEGIGGAGAAPQAGEHARRNGAPSAHEAAPDRVEISARARALAASEAASEPEPVGLLPQLVVRMRGRIAEQFYDRPDVMAETARSILASGDLWEAP